MNRGGVRLTRRFFPLSVALVIGVAFLPAAGKGPDAQALRNYLSERQLQHAEGELLEMFPSSQEGLVEEAPSETGSAESDERDEEDEGAPFERLSLAAQQEQLLWRALSGLVIALGLSSFELIRRWRQRLSAK